MTLKPLPKVVYAAILLALSSCAQTGSQGEENTLEMASLRDGPVLAFEAIIVHPGEKSGKPFIQGQGTDAQSGVEDISILVDAAIRCGARIAWADRRADHFEFAVTPAQKAPFNEEGWPLSDLQLVSCMKDTTILQFLAGRAKSTDVQALLEADNSPFISLMQDTSPRISSHSQSLSGAD